MMNVRIRGIYQSRIAQGRNGLGGSAGSEEFSG